VPSLVPPLPEKPAAPQKAPPAQPAQKQKLDKLVEATEGAQEDFLSVLKNVEKGARKRVQKNAEKKASGGKSAKTRKGVAGGALEGHLSAGEEDLIRRQIYPHWSILGGMVEAENLIVDLRLQISEDGTVTDIQILDKARFQRDPLYRVAAESAQRAVRLASPLKIPPHRAELFRSLRLRFNPKEALH
jgi:hypothetical protein